MLKTLKKKDCLDLSKVKRPPQPAIDVTSAVALVMGYEDTSWPSCAKMLSDKDFLINVTCYDRNRVTAPMLAKLRKIASADTFTPEHMIKISMCLSIFVKWLVSMEEYCTQKGM